MNDKKYSSIYPNDRSFTDTVHDNLAVKIIYSKMGWTPRTIENELSIMQDSEYSIDYHATDKNGAYIVIQERFRRPDKSSFDDFTLRYERADNPEEIEQKSEFYKMKGKLKRFTEPFYMVYGILNMEMNGFSKYAVLDLRAFFEHYKKNEIVIDEQIKFSKVEDGVLHCGVNGNFDNSSSFMCVSVKQLAELFQDIVVYQEGFIVKRTGDASDKQINMLRAMAKKNGFVLRNEDYLSKSDVTPLVELLKNEEQCKNIQNMMASGVAQRAMTYLSVKKA